MASDAAFCAPVVDPACTVRVRPARDILFVMDTSSAAPSFRTVLVSYMQTAFCSFGLGAGSRVGVISFGSDVQVALPLTAMGPADFATRMAQVTTTLLANAEVTRPVAEAFDLALVELARAGANAERLVVFFAVGPPSPVPLVSGSATQAHVPKYGYPYAAAYYAYLLCVTADAGACVKTSIDAYLTLQVATSLTALRAVGGLSFAAVLVPPTPSVLSNGIGYYSGTPEYVSGPSCTFDAGCVGACNWCKLYFNPISQQSECHCASLGAPLFLPSEVLNTGGQISGLNDTIVSVCETFELAPPTSQPAMASLSPTTALADASSGGLGTGAVVGIVLLALFIVACFVVVRARRRNAQLKDPDALRRKASMAAERRHSLATTQNFVFRNEEAGLSPTARDTDEARRLRDKGLGPLNRYHPTEQADKEWSQSVDHNTGAIFWGARTLSSFSLLGARANACSKPHHGRVHVVQARLARGPTVVGEKASRAQPRLPSRDELGSGQQGRGRRSDEAQKVLHDSLRRAQGRRSRGRRCRRVGGNRGPQQRRQVLAQHCDGCFFVAPTTGSRGRRP